MHVNVWSWLCFRLSTMNPCVCCCHKKWGLSQGTGDTLGTCLFARASLPSECQKMRPALLSGCTCSCTPDDKIYLWKRNFAYLGVILENRVQSWSCPCEGPDWPCTKLWFYLHSCTLEIMGAGKSTSVSSISFWSHLSVDLRWVLFCVTQPKFDVVRC